MDLLVSFTHLFELLWLHQKTVVLQGIFDQFDFGVAVEFVVVSLVKDISGLIFLIVKWSKNHVLLARIDSKGDGCLFLLFLNSLYRLSWTRNITTRD